MIIKALIRTCSKYCFRSFNNIEWNQSNFKNTIVCNISIKFNTILKISEKRKPATKIKNNKVLNKVLLKKNHERKTNKVLIIWVKSNKKLITIVGNHQKRLNSLLEHI